MLYTIRETHHVRPILKIVQDFSCQSLSAFSSRLVFIIRWTKVGIESTNQYICQIKNLFRSFVASKPDVTSKPFSKGLDRICS